MGFVFWDGVLSGSCHHRGPFLLVFCSQSGSSAFGWVPGFNLGVLGARCSLSSFEPLRVKNAWVEQSAACYIGR